MTNDLLQNVLISGHIPSPRMLKLEAFLTGDVSVWRLEYRLTGSNARMRSARGTR